jgi:ATP-dependent protease ClpP protease subunit
MKTTYFTFTGIIHEASVAQLMVGLNNLVVEQKPDEIYLLLSTPGGSVNAGIMLYNFLRALPVKITTHNIGQIDSIGTVVFLAGEDRFMAPATSFLFHGVAMNGEGTFRFSRSQLDEMMSQFKQDELRIATIVSDRTKLTAERIDGFYAVGESLGSKEALEVGIVGDVKLPTVPADAQSLVFSTDIPTN